MTFRSFVRSLVLFVPNLVRSCTGHAKSEPDAEPIPVSGYATPPKREVATNGDEKDQRVPSNDSRTIATLIPAALPPSSNADDDTDRSTLSEPPDHIQTGHDTGISTPCPEPVPLHTTPPFIPESHAHPYPLDHSANHAGVEEHDDSSSNARSSNYASPQRPAVSQDEPSESPKRLPSLGNESPSDQLCPVVPSWDVDVAIGGPSISSEPRILHPDLGADFTLGVIERANEILQEVEDTEDPQHYLQQITPSPTDESHTDPFPFDHLVSRHEVGEHNSGSPNTRPSNQQSQASRQSLDASQYEASDQQPPFDGELPDDELRTIVPCWDADDGAAESLNCPELGIPPPNLETNVASSVIERANGLLRRFEDDENSHLLRRAIHLLNHITPLLSDDALRAAFLYLQARCRSLLFGQTQDTTLLDQAIEAFQVVLDLQAWGHIDHHRTLVHYGNALEDRYDSRRDIEDLDRGIDLYRAALGDLEGLVNRPPSVVAHLGALLLRRHKRRRNDGDLNDAIGLFGEALSFLPDNHPDRSFSLSNLAIALVARYKNSGDTADVDDAIVCHRDALSLLSNGDALRPSYLNNLATALITHYKRLGNVRELEEAIAHHREILSLRPPSHPLRPSSLHNLATSLTTRYKTLGNATDMDEAIDCYREALSLLPDAHPLRPTYLSSLATALTTRCRKLGSTADVDEAISHHREALSLRLDDHPSRPSSLSDLAVALVARYERSDHIGDVEEAITYHREALSLLDTDHPARPSSLSNLAVALHTRYERLGSMSDVEEAIGYHHEALSLLPDDHPDRPSSLDNLAVTLITRYKRLCDIADVEEVIVHRRNALTLRPDDHPDRPSSLNNLATVLITRYSRLGNVSDVEEAIVHQCAVLSLLADDDPERPGSLKTLADTLLIHYKRSGRAASLGEGIRLLENACTICRPDNPVRSKCILSLANQLHARYEMMRDIHDLNEAISLYEEALTLRRGNHPDRPSTLERLGVALLQRAQDASDIELGLRHFKELLSLVPIRSPDRQSILINFLVAHPPLDSPLTDWAVLVDRCAEVARLTPSNHPSYAKITSLIAPVLRACHETVSELMTALGLDPGLSAEDAALALLRRGSRCSASPSIDRLLAICDWIQLCDKLGRPRTLEMYALLLEHLEVAVSRLCSLNMHHQLPYHGVLLRALGLVSEAVAFAIEQREVEMAVGFFERGRSVVLAPLSLQRVSASLGAVAPDLASRFNSLSWELECMTSADGKGLVGMQATLPFGDPISRSKTLRGEWDKVVEEVRAVAGFAQFLRPTHFADLQKSATEGPVILINVSRLRSDAIIITSQHAPVVVPLPWATPENLAGLFDRVAESTPRSNIRDSLRTLWESVVEPIVLVLEKDLGIPKCSRIWWCPTGAVTSLPLHAAGDYYRTQGRRLLDMYVSSYTPTIGALSRARQRPSEYSGDPSFLLVGQSRASDVSPLGPPLFADRMPGATVIEGDQATRDTVLSAVKAHRWIHLSCQGIVQPDDPLRSHFVLRDGTLSLAELMENLPAELAFLASCHPALGGSPTPEALVPLAAGMQFVGFQSVIGTMWGVDDEVGAELADEFYRMLMGRGEGDYRRSAEALNDAVKVFRGAKAPPERWISFVHWGI